MPTQGAVWSVVLAACLLSVRLVIAAEAPRPYMVKGGLPEDSTGLAARYPGDVGIEKDPAVKLVENFEHGDTAAFTESGRWTRVHNPAGMEFTGDVPPGSQGKLSVRMTSKLGEDTGAQLFTRLSPGWDQLFGRFYVKFAEGSGSIHHFVTMNANIEAPPYAVPKAGTTPEGDERFSSAMDVRGESKDEWRSHLSMYTYWHHMTTRWGTEFSPKDPFMLEQGRWYCFEFMIKANSDPEAFDGELAAWVDGELQLHYGGFNWRATNDLKINGFWLMYYVTDSVTRNPVNQVYFDDVVVATHYVGPLSPRAGD